MLVEAGQWLVSALPLPSAPAAWGAWPLLETAIRLPLVGGHPPVVCRTLLRQLEPGQRTRRLVVVHVVPVVGFVVPCVVRHGLGVLHVDPLHVVGLLHGIGLLGVLGLVSVLDVVRLVGRARLSGMVRLSGCVGVLPGRPVLGGLGVDVGCDWLPRLR